MSVTAGTLTPVSASNNNGVITVVLSWLTATGGTGPYTYAIQRSGASGFVPFGTYISGLTGLTETMTTPTFFLPPGSNFYRILATDSLGATALSNVAFLAVPSVLIAQTLSVVAVGANAKLTYAPSVGGIGAPYTYDVQRSPNADMSGSTDLGNHVSPYTDVAPPAGVNHYQITVTDTNSPVVDMASSNIVTFGAAPATLTFTGINEFPPVNTPAKPIRYLQARFYEGTLIPRMVGDRIKVGLERLKNTQGGPLWPYFASATVQAYLNGGSVFGPVRMAVDNTNWNILFCSYPLTTGTNNNLTAAGTYQLVYTVLQSDGTPQSWEQWLVINPRP